MKTKLNKNLIKSIQPMGGISFKDEKYSSSGTGYIACIRIYQYPESVDDFWLSQILLEHDCITTIDINTQDRTSCIENLRRSIKELEGRLSVEKDPIEIQEIISQINYTKDIADTIISSGEIIKDTFTRIFLSDIDKKKLEIRAFTLIKELEGKGFKSAIFLNETEFEFSSLISSYSYQNMIDKANTGLPLTSSVLGGGLPFNFSSLKDENGIYIGHSSTGGAVLFDQFHISNTRNSYESVIFGKKGAGKSTLIKTLLLHNIIKGNYNRIFDPSDEYTGLVESLGGRIIHLDGKDGMINILQIISLNEDNSSSFSAHINKIRVFYSLLSGTKSEIDLSEFERLVAIVYEKFNINKDNFKDKKPTEFPTLSDLLQIVQNEVYTEKSSKEIRKDISENRGNILENIQMILSSVVKNYGDLFDGYTTIKDFSKEKLISFNIKGLQNYSLNIFNTQMFNILNLLWSELLNQGSHMKKLYENKEISFENISRYLITVDEAHLLINSENEMIIDFFVTFAKQNRKYFGGFNLIFHDIKDVIPDISDNISINKIKTLFALLQYKFLLNQDASSIKTLQSVFENELTINESNKLPLFGKGEMILVGTGINNIKFKLSVSQYELDLFCGGV
ncbi:MAG: ATP-binding protein [Oscillospiraceae bacterium]|nr:ATP-binding protein [Oscillospiraceae bacterium]